MKDVKQKLNVLITTQALGLGGTEKALFGLLHALERDSVSVTFLLEKLPSKDWIDRLPNNVSVQELQFNNLFSYALVSLSNPYSDLFKRRLLSFFRKFFTFTLGHLHVSFEKRYEYALRHTKNILEKYDLALDFYGYGNFMTSFIARNVNADKKYTWIHSITLTGINRIASYLYDYDKVFCVSKATLKEFNQQYPEHKNKSELLYNCLDIGEINKKANETTEEVFKTDRFTIVSVGRLANEKGYDISVKAASVLRDEGYSFRWYFIGDGFEKENLIKQINECSLHDYVVLLGGKENPYPYIKHADLYVQTSRNEGFGLSVAEALALKKTVVASDIPSFREQIVSGETGYLVQNNPNEMAKCIKEIIEGNCKDLKKDGNILAFDEEQMFIFLTTIV